MWAGSWAVRIAERFFLLLTPHSVRRKEMRRALKSGIGILRLRGSSGSSP